MLFLRWADGDTVATHYAYGNDFLCTEDTGKSSSSLVFNSSNRHWLQKDYGLSLVSISQLAAKLQFAPSVSSNDAAS